VYRPERSSFDTTLRFELASDEHRPLFVSYLVATILATMWLVLVHAIPRPLLPPSLEYVPPVIRFVPSPALPPSQTDRQTSSESRGVQAPSGVTVRDMFSGKVGVVDAGRILQGVDVAASGSRADDAARLKVGLESGVGSRTPGRAPVAGVSPTSSGLGTVIGGGVSRNVVTIAPPEVVAVSGAPTGVTSEVGQTARAHVPQLERCYHREGLTRNPALAGLVRLSLTVKGGRVTSAHIVDRTWVGAGVAETESCLVRMAGGWRLGTADAQIVLPLSFTSPGR
jgi:hypothetical protein